MRKGKRGVRRGRMEKEGKKGEKKREMKRERRGRTKKDSKVRRGWEFK